MRKEIKLAYMKPIFYTIFPFVIPFIFYIPNEWINLVSKIIIVSLLIIIDIYFIIKISREELAKIQESQNILYSVNKYRISQSILNRLSNCDKIKGEFIKDECYMINNDYRNNILLYNSHTYLERVCDEIKSLISEITKIELEYISVSFIYQYPIYSDKWSGWKWITGKELTSDLQLHELILNSNTYFHHLILNDISASFENDKAILIAHNNYRASEKDNRHSVYGSISSHKMSFKNIDYTFCSGYLTISTYGKKFYSDPASEFKQILFDLVLPPFRKMIETELGFLYMRHKYRKENKEDQKTCMYDSSINNTKNKV